MPKPKGSFHAVELNESGDPVAVEKTPDIRIRRKAPGCWAFESQLAYRSVSGDEFIVPHDTETFVTDLMSMPWPFAWLVPGTGKHIPGVLVHDGLVVKLAADGSHGDHTHLGPRVTREEADFLLREAMYSEGTTFLRRWLMWAGVMLGTMWATFRPRSYWKPALVVYVLIISILGIGATLDLFDAEASWKLDLGRLRIPGVDWVIAVDWFWNLPWMSDRWWLVEVITGLSGAVAFTLVVSLLFLMPYTPPDPGSPRASVPAAGRLRDRYLVGVVAGLWFTVLLHVTLLVVLVYGTYRFIDKLIARRAERRPGAS